MKRLLFFIPLAIISCIQDNPAITISNNTEINYDSIKVYSTPNFPTIFRNLGSKETMEGQILFDNKNTSDGSYSIQIYENGNIIRHESFGYYTNGKSLDRRIKVAIEPDSLMISYR